MSRGTPDLCVVPVFKEVQIPATNPPKRKINFKLNSAFISNELFREVEMLKSKKVAKKDEIKKKTGLNGPSEEIKLFKRSLNDLNLI